MQCKTSEPHFRGFAYYCGSANVQDLVALTDGEDTACIRS